MTNAVEIYLDSNVLVEAFEQDTARADHARWILAAVEDGRLRAVTSELTLAEVLVKPLQNSALALAAAYETILEGGPTFDVVPVGRAVLLEAARVRAERSSIRLPDAIHVATARRAGSRCIITGDGRMSTSAGPSIVALGPYALDDILKLAS